MFIRWQHISVEHWPRRYADPVRWVRHKAILVESVRVNGKPRQKRVAFVANHVQGETPQEVEYQRITFWRDARKRLDQLGRRITPAARVIEAALAQHVQPTTAAEEDAFEREHKASVRRAVEGIIGIHEGRSAPMPGPAPDQRRGRMAGTAATKFQRTEIGKNTMKTVSVIALAYCRPGAGQGGSNGGERLRSVSIREYARSRHFVLTFTVPQY